MGAGKEFTTTDKTAASLRRGRFLDASVNETMGLLQTTLEEHTGRDKGTKPIAFQRIDVGGILLRRANQENEDGQGTVKQSVYMRREIVMMLIIWSLDARTMYPATCILM
jgi:hypothetical protein